MKTLGLKKLATVLLLASCAPNPVYLDGKMINEIPMYGGVKKSKALREIDEKFIRGEMSRGFSRDSTARLVARRGFGYLGQGDPVTAMKRFNQCWLLDSAEAWCHWGFGSALARMGYPDSGARFLERAYALDTSNSSLELDLAFTLVGAAHRMPPGDARTAGYRARSEEIFGRRARDASAAPKVFCLWARVKAFDKDIPGACRLMKSCTNDLDNLGASLGCAGTTPKVEETLEGDAP